jgi:hypothetical protein
MIKITIIIILILLMVITLYSYYCLSSRMINFERARLEYILQKESELGTKEKNIKVITDCSNKNEQLENALTNINKILGEIGIGGVNKFDDKNVNIVKGIKNIISGKIDTNIIANPDQINKSCNLNNNTSDNNNINSIINESIGTEILNEVPVEYLNNM